MDFTKIVSFADGNLQITVAGYLNEFADLGRHDFTKVKNLIIDFTQITMLNSRGVMTWFRWFGEARTQNKDLNIVFQCCPIFLVTYFNSVPLLPAGTKVKSFAAPMYCSNCDTPANLMLLEDKDYYLNPATQKYEVKTPQCACPKCSSSMEPDFSPEKYFSFLNAR